MFLVDDYYLTFNGIRGCNNSINGIGKSGNNIRVVQKLQFLNKFR
jgi:hypothetical protein